MLYILYITCNYNHKFDREKFVIVIVIVVEVRERDRDSRLSFPRDCDRDRDQKYQSRSTLFMRLPRRQESSGPKSPLFPPRCGYG